MICLMEWAPSSLEDLYLSLLEEEELAVLCGTQLECNVLVCREHAYLKDGPR